jgi:hypothetical protein
VTTPAAELWDLIADWAGKMRWWLPAELGGLGGPALVSCELVGTQKRGAAFTSDAPQRRSVGVEQVIYQDDDARRTYYTKSADIQMTGYPATT